MQRPRQARPARGADQVHIASAGARARIARTARADWLETRHQARGRRWPAGSGTAVAVARRAPAATSGDDPLRRSNVLRPGDRSQPPVSADAATPQNAPHPYARRLGTSYGSTVMMKEVYLVGGARTAIGAFAGAYADVPAPALGSTVIKAALQRAQVPQSEEDDDRGSRDPHVVARRQHAARMCGRGRRRGRGLRQRGRDHGVAGGRRAGLVHFPVESAARFHIARTAFLARILKVRRPDSRALRR